MNKNKLFTFNREKFKERIIASTKQEAYDFMVEFLGGDEEFQEIYTKNYLIDNPNKDIKDFINEYFIEEKLDAAIKVCNDWHKNTTKTKKASEWIQNAQKVPVYIGAEQI